MRKPEWLKTRRKSAELVMTKKQINIQKKPELPYFKEGSLIFKESGHRLTKSDRHYRCALDCKGKCGKNEPQLKVENLERNFTNFSYKFAIPENSSNFITKKFMREILVDIVIEVTEDSDADDDLIDATYIAAVTEMVQKKGVTNDDIKTMQEALFRRQKKSFPLVLMGHTMEAVGAFNNVEDNKGRLLSLISKNIYLSNEGKIVELELELWGWYTLNYINKYVPNYLRNLKENGVIITNEKHQILSLELTEASKSFVGRENEALSNYRESNMQGILQFLKDSMLMLVEGDKNPKKRNAMLLVLMKTINDNPALQMIFPALPMIPPKKIVIKKPSQRKV